jgi:hypothetical protein
MIVFVIEELCLVNYQRWQGRLTRAVANDNAAE